MRLRIEAELDYQFTAPTSVLLAIEVAPGDDQQLVVDRLTVDGAGPLTPVAGECGVGRRTWTVANGRLLARYAATVDVTRPDPDWASLRDVAPSEVPPEFVQFLWPSRYCQSDRLCAFVRRKFKALRGGPAVAAMAAWIQAELDYVRGSSDTTTTAVDSFVKRQGICRDYAHLMVSFARAADIPARTVAAYAPGVSPPDFHAVAEVWLTDGERAGWHLIDATGMSRASEIARIAVGRDATDISFMTSFGNARLNAQKVSVQRVPEQEQPPSGFR